MNHADRDENKKIADYIVDDINKNADLPTAVPLSVGARVMVRYNIDVTDKIFNGVYGTVKYINLHKNQNASGPKSDNSVSAKAVD